MLYMTQNFFRVVVYQCSVEVMLYDLKSLQLFYLLSVEGMLYKLKSIELFYLWSVEGMLSKLSSIASCFNHGVFKECCVT